MIKYFQIKYDRLLLRINKVYSIKAGGDSHEIYFEEKD